MEACWTIGPTDGGTSTKVSAVVRKTFGRKGFLVFSVTRCTLGTLSAKTMQLRRYSYASMYMHTYLYVYRHSGRHTCTDARIAECKLVDEHSKQHYAYACIYICLCVCVSVCATIADQEYVIIGR